MTEQEQVQLLPCPFCGGEANLHRAHQNKMLALGEMATDDHYLFTLSHHDCAGGFSIVWPYKPKAALIAAWNTRHTATAEALEAMREAREALGQSAHTLTGATIGKYEVDFKPALELVVRALTRLTAAIAKIEGEQP
jgi:hypothetical protein